MENTIENKAKFLAQYFGQNTFYCGLFTRVYGLDIFRPESISGIYAELKSLSSITDEDAIEVSRVWGSEMESKIIGYSIVIRITDIEKGGIQTEFRNTIGVIDYLRSRGYALPFMGTSVEKLIEYGWIKLTTLPTNH